MSHKSEDYKISAVNYYNKNDVSMDEVWIQYRIIFLSLR